jgi:uncharacterized protein
MDIQSLRVKREEILQSAEKYGARTVRIFGSVARGEADVASDLDLLVEMEPGRSLLDLGGLLMELQDLLGCHVDVVTEKGLRERIRDKVLREAVLYMRVDTQLLLDIIEAINRSERYSSSCKLLIRRSERFE